MFAARLALALKTRLGAGGLAPALLVLDEPFYTLDQSRAAAALKLLGAFQKETDWQIILLTKDPAVRAAAESAIPATIIEL
jgi:ABC-type Mn2+/Zn2+ transport system ATPase subunit